MAVNRNALSTADLAVLWGIKDKNTLWTTIKRYVASGKLYKIHRGLYSKIPVDKLSDYELARAPCGNLSYVTLETILSKAGAMSQSVDPIILADQKSQTIKYGNKTIICKQLKPDYKDRFPRKVSI